MGGGGWIKRVNLKRKRVNWKGQLGGRGGPEWVYLGWWVGWGV